MNKKYERYIDYIVNDLEIPYFINMKEMYGLSEKEYEMVLSKIYNQPVTIRGHYVYNYYVYNNRGNEIYEDADGYWVKREYDDHGNLIYREDSTGFWVKYEYDNQGNEIYSEDSNGYIIDNR
jgi:YD repeat-containing protein